MRQMLKEWGVSGVRVRVNMNNQCINLLMTRAQQSVHQYFRSQLASLGVTPVQYAVMDALWREDNLTPSQIASAISLDGSTVTGILDRLESKGLCKRLPDPNDRRALRVVLTESGRALEAPLMKVIAECNETILATFTTQEKDTLIELLQRLG